MARPGALITDFRHVPDDLDVTGRSLEAFLASIVAVASLEGPEARLRAPLRCRRRPKRRACQGAILVDRRRGHSELEWHCSECDFNGVITHWEGSAWDVGEARPGEFDKEDTPMPKRSLSHADLKRAQLPAPRSRWEDIQSFALTFNGYNRIGDRRLTELANRHLEAGTVPSDLDELRGCLFFEQRRWHAQDGNPDETTMRHVWALIEGIRAALEQMPVQW